VNKTVVSPTIKLAKPIVTSYIEQNYEYMARQQKETFLRGYDTAVELLTEVAANHSDPTMIGVIQVMHSLRENISQQIDLQMSREKEKIVLETQQKILNNVQNALLSHWKLLFVTYLLFLYGIISFYFSVVNLFVKILEKVIKHSETRSR
jgi:hypothetical protein